jgi:rhamnosyltransferase subunit B
LGVVVMSVTGTAGDIAPLIAIGRYLAAGGHHVTLLSHAPFRARAVAAGIEFVALDTPGEYLRLLRGGAALVGHAYDLDAVERAVGWYHTPQRREREFTAVAERVDGQPAVVLARYLSNSVAISAAQQLAAGCGWSLVSPHALAEAVALAELHGARYRERLNHERAQFGLPAVDDWLGWVSTVAVRIGLWPQWFAPDTASVPNSALVGFVGDDTGDGGPVPADIWEFLAAGETPILVTAGSGMMIAPGFFKAAVGGCVRAHRRVILVTRDAEGLPPWPTASVHRRVSAPLASLLPHVAAVIHHGGIGTSARSLAAGVPQLVLAEGVDRPDNATRLARLGVAETLPLPAWTPGSVAEALSRLVGPEFRDRAAAYARRLRASGAVATAGRLVEGLMPGHAVAARSSAYQGGSNAR